MIQKIIVFSSALFFLILSIFLQTHMYQDWDLLYALEGSKRLLAGGTYVTDMFDNNPPLIFYYSIFVNILSNILHINNIFIFKFIIYICIFYSLSICYYIKQQTIDIYLLLGLSACFLLLPIYCFGEREHLMIILTMPYFFLVYQYGLGILFSTTIRLTISVLAGLGFALKPHFLFSFLFVELLLMYWQKKWWSIFRLEPLIVLSVIILYLIAIAVFTPSYYYDILPLVWNYYVFNNNSINFVITRESLTNALLLVVGCLLLLKLDRMEQLLIATILGFTLSFILQGKGWYYHALPLITINSLLTIKVICSSHLNLAKNSSMKNGDQLAWKCNDKSSIYPAFLAIIIGAQFLYTIIPTARSYYGLVSCTKYDLCGYLPIANIAKKYAKNKPIFFFATRLSNTIPIVYYSDAKLGSRFPILWVLSGILNREASLSYCDKLCQNTKNTMRRYIVEDFERYQPELVFVDISLHKFYIRRPFDYLAFMTESPTFKILWQQYDYLLTSNNYAIYKKRK